MKGLGLCARARDSADDYSSLLRAHTLQLLQDLLSPETAAQCINGYETCSTVNQDSSAGHQASSLSSCCKGEEAHVCGCIVGDTARAHSAGGVSSSSASTSGIGPRGPGLPKDEYRRLKKAGQLPPKDPALQAQQAEQSLQAASTKVPHKSTTGRQAAQRALADSPAPRRLGGMVVLYASQTGNAHNLAKDLYEDASEKGFAVELADIAAWDFAAFVQRAAPLPVVVIVVSTWTDGTPPPKAQGAFRALFDNGDRWRHTSLARMRYAVFGLGNSVYADNFCKAARDLDARLHALGAQRVCARGELVCVCVCVCVCVRACVRVCMYVCMYYIHIYIYIYIYISIDIHI